MSSVDALVEEIRRVAREEIAPRADDVDFDRSFPAESLRALADVGAWGLVVPAESGGAGGGLAALADACEAVGGACASTGMVFLMHCVTTATLAAGGGEAAATAIPRMAKGEALGTLAFSERGTGAHFYDPQLKVERRKGTLTVSGRKSFVTSGSYADHYLILVQSEEEGADAYLVERDVNGIAFDGLWDGLGMAGNSSIAMILHGVRLEPASLVGTSGRALDLVFGTVAPFFLVGLAAVNVGIAAAALDVATTYARTRTYPDGSSLADVQYVQHRLADMDAAVRQARLLGGHAALLGDARDAGALVPIMEAKIAATEAAVAVTQDALQVTGGSGYSRELPIERHLRDARAGSVMAPTNSVLRSWVGRALAGLPVP